MHLRRILTVALIGLCLLYLALQICNLEFQADGVRVLLVLLLSLLYYVSVSAKRLFFVLFLLTFTIAELINFSSWFIVLNYETTTDYFYYGVNILYVIAYLFLIFRALRGTNLKQVFSKFWIHIGILTVLDIFCVAVLAGTTENHLSRQEYIMEFSYNIVIMVLLTVGMINYISKSSQKSMNLLLGTIFIFFSEVLQLTYYYVSEILILNVVSSLFMVLAFLFFFLQARLPMDTDHNELPKDLFA